MLELFQTATLSLIGSEFHSRDSCEVSVVEGVGRAAHDTGCCVCRSKSTNADTSDGLTVLRQVTCQVTGQALENQDGDLEVDMSSYW